MLADAVRSNFPGQLFINARADIALAVGADGVHLTSKAPTERAVRTFGSQLLVGVSTHSQLGAERAQAAGCDYAFLSPIFATPSKETLGQPLGIEPLRQTVSALALPILALGGIDASNVGLVWTAGAHGVAAIRGFEESPETLSASLPG